MADMPASTQPKVKETVIAGAIATFTVWVWNTYWGDLSDWYLDEVVTGTWVTIVTWLTGPAIRRWQSWGEAEAERRNETRELIEAVRELAKKEPTE